MCPPRPLFPLVLLSPVRMQRCMSLLFSVSCCCTAVVMVSVMMSCLHLHLLALMLPVVVIAGEKNSPWQYLTHDWTAGEANLFSPLAKKMYESQRMCDTDKIFWWTPRNAGMGSNIHVSGSSACLIYRVWLPFLWNCSACRFGPKACAMQCTETAHWSNPNTLAVIGYGRMRTFVTSILIVPCTAELTLIATSTKAMSATFRPPKRGS